MQTFKSLPRIVQILLLLFPAINWIVEIIIRVCQTVKKPTGMHIVMLILSVVCGTILGWVDLVWLLINNHLVVAK